MARRGGGGDELAGYLTAAAVARVLGVSVGRVRQLAVAGELPAGVRIAGRWFYRRAEIERLKRARDKKRRQR